MKDDEYVAGNREICFWQDKKATIVLIFENVGIRGIYLSLAIGTAKFKLD